ncbi:MAG: hypothetical protein EXS25_08285 [Pedosphaera sp.]|nr:hypothetical protein [Pedosphaera sp.]
MNSTAVQGLAIGLLTSFGLVIGVAAIFAAIYRRHLLALRLANRAFDPLTRLGGVHRRSAPVLIPGRWLAVRGSNRDLVCTALGPQSDGTLPWNQALLRHRERSFFISQPVEGWMLIMGGAIPDPFMDIDVFYLFLTRLSRGVGEVHSFSVDRVLNYHAWALLRGGSVVRAYAWAGETVWNQGPITLDEKMLGLKCRDYGDDINASSYGTVPTEQNNADRLIFLARKWGCDPVDLIETLLLRESPPEESGYSGNLGSTEA